MDMTGNTIKVSVEDDGRGFDADAAFSSEEGPTDTRTQGILALKEEYELLGGSVSVVSSESDGTTVKMELPAEDFAF